MPVARPAHGHRGQALRRDAHEVEPGPARSLRGLFVAGTDTGVGKTLVACALLRGLRNRGVDVGAMKPVETGVGTEGPLDAIALRTAAGATDTLDDICPQRFALAAAPSIAAASEGGFVDLARIEATFESLSKRHDVVVVEGAGGLLVPIADGVDMAGLASRLELPVLLVARAALGTINHTLLSLEAIERRGLVLAGVVVSHGPRVIDPAEIKNLDVLRAALGPRMLGEIPVLAAGAVPAAGAIDLPSLLRVLGHVTSGPAR